MVAATRGHDGMVKMFLARKDVTSDKPDDQGQTPLMSAYANRNKRAIELLELREAVDSEPKAKRPRHHLVATL